MILIKYCIFITVKIYNKLSHWKISSYIPFSVHRDVSSVVDRGFEPQSGQTKKITENINLCRFSAKHTALKTKSKDWCSRNKENMLEWRDMSASGLLFQWDSTIKIQLSVLVWYIEDIRIIHKNITCYLWLVHFTFDLYTWWYLT